MINSQNNTQFYWWLSPKKEIALSQIRLLFNQAGSINALVIFAALAIIFLLYKESHLAMLMTWATAMVVVALLRIFLAKQHGHTSSQLKKSTYHLYQYLGLTFLLAVLWSLLPLLFFEKGNTVYLLILIAVVVCSSGINVLSSVLTLAIVYITPALLTLAYSLYINDAMEAGSVIVSFVIILFLFLRSAMNYNRFLLHSMGLSFDLKNTEIAKLKYKIKFEQQARELAENSNQAKSEFLSQMSHELRTPLNAILGFSQLLNMDTGKTMSKQQHDNLEEISVAGKYLLQLINDILDLSKIEADGLSVSIEYVAIAELMAEAIHLVQPLAKSSGINFHVKFNGTHTEALDKTDIVLKADKTRLKQCIINLLSNAIKYNEKNGDVFVDCDEIADNKTFRINVTDTGIGIDSKEKSMLFKPFMRFGVNKASTEGTGIGLVITKQLIEKMGGKIKAESELNKGSTFSIELPYIRTA